MTNCHLTVVEIYTNNISWNFYNNQQHSSRNIVLAKRSQIHKVLALGYFFQYFDTNYYHQPQCLLMMLLKRLELLKVVKKTYFYKYCLSLKEAFDWLKNWRYQWWSFWSSLIKYINTNKKSSNYKNKNRIKIRHFLLYFIHRIICSILVEK